MARGGHDIMLRHPQSPSIWGKKDAAFSISALIDPTPLFAYIRRKSHERFC